MSFVAKQKEILTSIDNIKTKVELLGNILNQTEAFKKSSNRLQKCGAGTENDKMFSWCNAVPSTVHIRDDIWKDKQAPAEDDLDRFLVNKTGCTYIALRNSNGIFLPEASYDGTLDEWRVSVRTGDTVWMRVWWGGSYRYSFGIGYNENPSSWVSEHTTNTEHSLPTREYVSRARYVTFYVRIQPGTMTFGRECDSAPLYTGTHPAVARGTTVMMYLYSQSVYGAKFLYNCPAVTGNTTQTASSSCTN